MIHALAEALLARARELLMELTANDVKENEQLARNLNAVVTEGEKVLAER